MKESFFFKKSITDNFLFQCLIIPRIHIKPVLLKKAQYTRLNITRIKPHKENLKYAQKILLQINGNVLSKLGNNIKSLGDSFIP